MANRATTQLNTFLALAGVTAALALGVVTYRALAAPYRQAADMAKRNEVLRQRLLAAEQAANEAERQTRYLRTDAGLEWLAREQGRLKPGEKPLLDP